MEKQQTLSQLDGLFEIVADERGNQRIVLQDEELGSGEYYLTGRRAKLSSDLGGVAAAVAGMCDLDSGECKQDKSIDYADSVDLFDADYLNYTDEVEDFYNSEVRDSIAYAGEFVRSGKSLYELGQLSQAYDQYSKGYESAEYGIQKLFELAPELHKEIADYDRRLDLWQDERDRNPNCTQERPEPKSSYMIDYLELVDIKEDADDGICTIDQELSRI